MDQETVETLEERIEVAIAVAMTKMDLRKLPLLPYRRTMHLMTKAAATVCEAAAGKKA